MTYSVTIDNIHAYEWGLTIQEAYIFAWLHSLPSWATKKQIENVDYYFASRHKVSEELPLFTDKPDTVYRYYKRLEEKGLITLQKIGFQDYVCLTEKGTTWNRRTELGKKSEDSEINPIIVGKKSGSSSEKNPTYNNINTNKEINITFDDFWSAYNHKIGKNKAALNWNKLTIEEQALAFKDAPIYKASLPSWRQPKDPATYLHQKCWEDDRTEAPEVKEDVHVNSSSRRIVI